MPVIEEKLTIVPRKYEESAEVYFEKAIATQLFLEVSMKVCPK